MDSMEKSLDMLERDIKEAADVASECTQEWCEATEHYIDDIGNYLFSIHEPRWADPEDSKRLKNLKKRLHDIYAEYKSTAEKAA
jgi:hypothetical protein